MLAVAYCLAISILYVASLYIWKVPASRQHPKTVKARMLGVLLTACVAWVPCWHMHRQLSSLAIDTSHGGVHNPPAQAAGTAAARAGSPEFAASVKSANRSGSATGAVDQLAELPALLQLLGLHRPGRELSTALLTAASLTLLLFLGPVYHKAITYWQMKAKPDGHWYKDSKPWLHQARDYVVSPIAEEWCFRACMVPLLWMQGCDWKALLLITPLFFGVCHLHHGWGLVQAYGPSGQVAGVLLLQLLYTTVFGWYATWVFLSTGSILAAILVHSICNVLGLPPFREMGKLSLLLCAVGVVLFTISAPRLLHAFDAGSFWWTGHLQVAQDA